MKKLLALLLALTMVFAFAACGGKSDADDKNDKTEENGNNNNDNNDKNEDKDDDKNEDDKNEDKGDSVKEWFEENGDALEDEVKDMMGEGVEISIRVKGDSLIVKMCMEGIDEIDDETKTAIEDAMEEGMSQFDGIVDGIRGEIPSLESLVYEVCEEDGDLIVEVVLD